MAGSGRATPGYYFAIVLLVVGLVGGAGLLFLLTANPISHTPKISVTREDPGGACPIGNRATVCYNFEITNVGNTTTTAECFVVPIQGNDSTFLNGESRATTVPLQPNGTTSLSVRVLPSGNDTLQTPELSCTPA